MSLAGRIYRRIIRDIWKLSMLGLERGHHVTRYSMYRALAATTLPTRMGHVLSISHSANLAKTMGIRPTQLTEANFPDVTMLSLPYPDATFDFILSDQVLEHIEGSPQAAIDECSRVLKPGGIVCHTTCFMNPLHKVPGDYWRFTEDGLRVLHAKYSEVIACGSWGNFDIWRIVALGMRGEPVPHAQWHPLHKIAVKNDPEWAAMTWIVARK